MSIQLLYVTLMLLETYFHMNKVFDIYVTCLILIVRQGSPRKRKGPISGTKGTDRFRSEEAFYVNPLPDCLCQKESRYTNSSRIRRQPMKVQNTFFWFFDGFGCASTPQCACNYLLKIEPLVPPFIDHWMCIGFLHRSRETLD